MVVFVDFESEDDDPHFHHFDRSGSGALTHVHRSSPSVVRNGPQEHISGSGPEENTISNGKLFASALACYPVSLSIAAQLDLTDLYSLSLTCRRVNDGLSQFAYQLRTQSLRCTNDVPPTRNEEEADAVIFREAMAEMAALELGGAGAAAFPLPFRPEGHHLHVGHNSSIGTSGKVSKCARDLVAPCRKCGIVVCRNCAVKPPSNRNLPNRHRRLCRTCLDAPLTDHLRPLSDARDFHESPPTSSASSARSVRTLSSSVHSDYETHGVDQKRLFTSSVFLRESCQCVTRGVYLCQPCGQSLNATDTTYKRVWTWRSRYSTHIGGGLGTGLGLGNQGQKCGRGEYCLERGAAGVCWVEIECSESRAQNKGYEEAYGISRSSTPMTGDHENDGVIVNRPGYLSQELEGIGGVLKKKVKKRVKVGATVYEFDDERETGKYLLRESSGKQRSWCGWCSRVCPGEQDKDEADRLLNQHEIRASNPCS